MGAITKHLLAKYPDIDGEKSRVYLRNAFRQGLKSEALVLARKEGKGAGSYKIAKTGTEKPKKKTDVEKTRTEEERKKTVPKKKADAPKKTAKKASEDAERVTPKTKKGTTSGTKGADDTKAKKVSKKSAEKTPKI